MGSSDQVAKKGRTPLKQPAASRTITAPSKMLRRRRKRVGGKRTVRSCKSCRAAHVRCVADRYGVPCERCAKKEWLDCTLMQDPSEQAPTKDGPIEHSEASYLSSSPQPPVKSEPADQDRFGTLEPSSPLSQIEDVSSPEASVSKRSTPEILDLTSSSQESEQSSSPEVSILKHITPETSDLGSPQVEGLSAGSQERGRGQPSSPGVSVPEQSSPEISNTSSPQVEHSSLMEVDHPGPSEAEHLASAEISPEVNRLRQIASDALAYMDRKGKIVAS